MFKFLGREKRKETTTTTKPDNQNTGIKGLGVKDREVRERTLLGNISHSFVSLFSLELVTGF